MKLLTWVRACLFNTPLPMNPHHKRLVSAESHEHLAGQPVKETIHMTKGRRMFVMQCGFHAYMESWGLAVDNPYYALTGDGGTFTLTDVPPGEYTLMAWHPGVGTMLTEESDCHGEGSGQPPIFPSKHRKGGGVSTKLKKIRIMGRTP